MSQTKATEKYDGLILFCFECDREHPFAHADTKGEIVSFACVECGAIQDFTREEVADAWAEWDGRTTEDIRVLLARPDGSGR